MADKTSTVRVVRILELVVTCIACVVLTNLVFQEWFNTPDLLLKLFGENAPLIELASGSWLLALVFTPKQFPRIL